jgi:hypothetical protein
MAFVGLVPTAARHPRAAGFVRPVNFRRILGERAWRTLPAAVQARFAVTAHLVPGAYEGAMQVRASLLGLAFAQACRLLGTPLTPWTGDDVPVRVEVYGDATGALVWDRTYSFPNHPPIRVSSRKMQGRRGELMEVIHGGLGMMLALTVEDRALHFRSTGYFARLGPVRLPIPLWFTPGRAHVIHEDQGGGVFRFTLRFIHPLAGETIFQTGLFHDPAEFQPQARP